MASITPCCKKLLDRLLRPLCVLLLAGATTLALAQAQAGSIETRKAALQQTEEGAVLNAEFSIDMGDRMEESLQHGIVLTLVLEFDLTRPRWYWTNEQIVSRQLTYRLSYAALTRQYKVAVGHLNVSFNSLAEALSGLSTLKDWPVVDKSALRAGDTYIATLRFGLDRSQLPRPLQLDAIGSKDWQFESKPHRWNFTAVAPISSATFSTETRQ